MLKRTAAVTLLVVAIVVLVIYATGYHGRRSFKGGTSTLPEVGSVIEHARSLAGVVYDPLMGKHGNIGAATGFIVCSDVPNLAYGLAGFSIQTMLEDDFMIHRTAYDSANGNKPGNPYFHRRARNLFAFFEANSRLIPAGAMPAVGDLAFYRHDPKSYISHVALVTSAGAGTYSVMESAPETVFAQEVPGASPINRGWLLAGFGRMYLIPKRSAADRTALK